MISDLIGSSPAIRSGTQWFPDPYYDYASMYAPRSLPSMLRWCEILWANNPTYRMALERVVAYFLTDIEILDVADAVRKRYGDLLKDPLRVPAHLRTIGMDALFYGNSFSSIFYPFRRYLACPKCRCQYPLSDKLFTFRDYKFFSTCERCGHRGEHDRVDRPTMEQDKLRIVRWNPHYMQLLYHPVSHDICYLYRIPADLRQHVQRGTPFYVQYLPWDFVEAIRDDGLFRFDDDVVFHLKEDTLAGVQNRGWGIPRALSLFKTGFYLQVLKRYNEALAMDYIVPWRVITPAQSSRTVDPALHVNLEGAAAEIQRMIRDHRVDPLSIHMIPFPIQYQMIGGGAQQLAPNELLTFAMDELLNGCGVPAELYRGTLQYQALPGALRLFEATWPHLVSGFNAWLGWLMRGISRAFNWELARARMVPVTRADDIEARMMRLQLAASQTISHQTALAPLGIDVRDEIKRIFDEQRMLAEEANKAQKEQAQAEEMNRRLSEGAAVSAGGVMPQMPAAGGALGAPSGPMSPGDVLTTADQMAQQLLTMPEASRRRQLNMLRQTDETLHAVVKERLSQARSQARSIGQEQVLGQMAGAPVM